MGSSYRKPDKIYGNPTYCRAPWSLTGAIVTFFGICTIGCRCFFCRTFPSICAGCFYVVICSKFYILKRSITMGKISGKTHTKEQLDNWANQNNPNNKAYRANMNNRTNQLNPYNKAARFETGRLVFCPSGILGCRPNLLEGFHPSNSLHRFAQF